MANMVCAVYKLPKQINDLHDYIETLDDTKFLAFNTSVNSSGEGFAIVVTKT